MSLAPEVQKIVDEAKALGHLVYSMNINGIKYIYRSINRLEFKELQELMVKEAESAKIEADSKKKDLPEKDPKIDAINQALEMKAAEIRERGEERLVGKGVLHPVITANAPAGVSTTLADRIMEASGFGAEEEPEQL